MKALFFKRIHVAIFSLLSLTLFGQEELIIKEVHVTGIQKTKEQVILRELIFKSGDTLTEEELSQAILQSRRNLRNTSLFNTIDINIHPIDGTSEINVEISITERWYFWPYPIVEFVDPNFNLWWETKDLSRTNLGLNFHWQNFRGRNESIYFLGQTGYSQALGLTYQIPFINKGQRWGVSISPLYEQRDEVVAGTNNNERNLIRSGTGSTREILTGSIGISYRRKFFTTHKLSIKAQRASVLDTVLDYRSDYLGPQGETQIRYMGLAYRFRIDRRDNQAYPKDGHFINADLVARGFGLINQSNLKVLWAAVDLRKFKDFGRWGVALGFKGKTNLSGRQPYYFQEGLGYSQYIRGYEYYIIDGQHYALFKNDLRLTMIKRHTYTIDQIRDTRFNTFYYAAHAVLFFDAGYVVDRYYQNINPLANNWQGSIGLGIHFETFYDKVFRFEVAINRREEVGYFIHFTQPI